MFKRPIALVARRALECILVAEIHRVLKCSIFRRECLSRKSLVNSGVAYAAFISDDFSFLTEMLSVMAAKATLGVQVTYVVRVRGPIGLHLGEKVSLIDPLHFRDRPVHRISSGRINVPMISLIV